MYRYIHIKYINRIMLDGDNNNILYTYRYYSAYRSYVLIIL